MKILITGGNGFIARNIRPMMENVGHSVLAPSHETLDITKLEELRKYISTHEPDAIIHAASKGGHRTTPDTYSDFLANIVMFENLMKVVEDRRMIIYSSGAEFDRRFPIDQANEVKLFKSWPVDYYGLSKNIIARRVLNDHRTKKIDVLRIFNCFNHDEMDTRFIKRSILNIKNGLPIQIHQNRKMDFVYLDDVFTVTEFILLYHTGFLNTHLNLVYYEKKTLLDVANIICKYTSHLNPKIVMENKKMGISYTGEGHSVDTLISRYNIQMIGLEEGIKRTVSKLL